MQYDYYDASSVVAALPSTRIWQNDVSYNRYTNEPRTKDHAIRITHCFAFERESANILPCVDSVLDRVGGEAFCEPLAGSGKNWAPWPNSRIPVNYKNLTGALVENAPESKSLFITFTGFAWYHLR